MDAENKKETAVTRLLLIEDDALDVKWVRRVLGASRLYRYEIENRQDLASALSWLNEFVPDVLLMDLGLPDSRGLESYRRVRKLYPSLPIVILSAQAEEENAIKAIRSGAQDYLIKGEVEEAVLERILHYAIERKRLETMRDEFTSMIVHELRAPLSVSIESNTVILDGMLGEITEEQRKFIRMALRNMEQLNHLVDNLLRLSQLELGKIELAVEKLNLAEFIEEILGGFRLICSRKGLDLKFENEAGNVIITADRNKLNQVITNLISNAVKFTEQGHVSCLLRKNKACIEVEVADTGAGIAGADLKHVFDKYRQFGRKKEKGAGLGLAISRGIVHAHNGTIRVESTEGKGTVFTVTLPSDESQVRACD